MLRYLMIVIMLVSCGCFLVAAVDTDAQSARSEFEKLADRMPYLSLSAVLYNRPYHLMAVPNLENSEVHFQVLGKVTGSRYTRDVLLGLLTHHDAKVRTLAAVALFDKEDPSVLPSLVKLCNDNAETFDGYPENYSARPNVVQIPPPAKKQTVGDIATAMVSFYMKPSGFYYGISHPTEPGFAEYWEARNNRSYCASWFAVQLSRAGRSSSPTPDSYIPDIRRVREKIDKLPPVDRAWTLLWLNGEYGSAALVTQEELVEACISVGPDKLLAMLQKHIPSDDPDLQPSNKNNWPYKRMQQFVLRHAQQVLRATDSETLLACERWERDYRKHGISHPTITPWWAVAAAKLEPAKANEILSKAIKRFDGEYDSEHLATLYTAMWQLLGKAQEQRIVNWFYTDLPQRGSFPNCRGQFIEAMRKETNGRQIIVPIIKDKRLDELDWQSLERLVRAVNGWVETPIVTDDQLREVRHPFGQGHYYWEKDKAMKNYPKETSELNAHLHEWRERLRRTIPELMERR